MNDKCFVFAPKQITQNGSQQSLQVNVIIMYALNVVYYKNTYNVVIICLKHVINYSLRSSISGVGRLISETKTGINSK